MIRLIVIAYLTTTILPYVNAFSVTLPMAGSSLQEGSSFVVGWAFPPSTGSADIKLVTGAGEPYTPIATLKSGVSLLQVLTTVSIPNNVTAGAYYIQIGDAPSDAIGGPYKVTTDPLLSTASSIMTASSSLSSAMASSSASISSSLPLSSTTSSLSIQSTSSSPIATDTSGLDANPTLLPLSNSGNGSANGGMIGGIVGGVAAAILVPASILLWRRNKRKQRQQEMSDAIFWNQQDTHDHDDGPSWGYPSSLKYSNASVVGGGAYDPSYRQDNASPYSQAGYYEGYNTAAAMHQPAPAMTREAAMAAGAGAAAYYNGYQHQTPDESGKFEENEKVHLNDEIEPTQKPDQK